MKPAIKPLFFIWIIFPVCLFSGSTYWGATGIIRIPTARVIEDGDLRFTFSHSYPYRNYGVTFGFLPFLELNGRITEFRNQKLEDEVWEGYGYTKDKAADFKLLLLKEGKLLPAVSIGVQDIQGTQRFFSEYVVASKTIGKFDFTAGYGGNLFGDIFREENTDVRELDGFFSGVEWKIKDNLSLLFEYDPTTRLSGDTNEISSHYNYGVRWEPNQWVSVGYSYQRGDTHSFLITFTYPFGKILAPQKPDEPFYGPVDWTPLQQTLAIKPLSETLQGIQNYIVEAGFKDVEVAFSGDVKSLYIDFENKRYLSHNKAAGRILRIAVARAPSDVAYIYLTLRQQGIAMVEIKVPRADYIDYLNGIIDDKEILSKIVISSRISEKDIWWDMKNTLPKKRDIAFESKFVPIKLDSFLNDPTGFFHFRVGPGLFLHAYPAKGLIVESYIKFPFYSDVETNQPPISDSPVRSDVYEYLDNTGISIENLMVNQFLQLGPNKYLKLGGGLMELQYAGLTAERLKIFKDGRIAFGPEVIWAKKRDPDNTFGLQGEVVFSPFWNLYVYVPELNTTLSAKLGRFLAGDEGVRMEVSREVRGGRIFLWYTKTDTSDFTGENRNYCDKGVGFAIPIRVFEKSDRQGHYSMALSPWSRDTGQTVNQPYSLFDFIRQFTPIYIQNHWQEITE